MEYKNLVRDFAERTLKNLEAIECAKARTEKADLYEVTQLINSMLGLLIFPQQESMNKIPETPISDLKTQGWPIPDMKGSPPHASNLRDLVRCLRNGISHFNLEFTSDGHVLTGVKLWNCKTDKKIRVWEVTLMLHELKTIVRRFVALLLEIY